MYNPNLDTQKEVSYLIDDMIGQLKYLLGIDEIIPACEIIDTDSRGVGATTLPRFIQVRIHRYYQEVMYRGFPEVINVGDFITAIHIREGDQYEVLGAGGSGGYISPVPKVSTPPHFSSPDILLNLAFDNWYFQDSDNRNVFLTSRRNRVPHGPSNAVYSSRGSLHFEPSLWPTRRGVRLEDAGLNYLINPEMYDGNANNIADNWTFADTGLAGAITTSIEHNEKKVHGWVQQWDYTGLPGDAGDASWFYSDSAVGSFAPGDDATFSIDLRGFISGCAITIWINAYNNVGAYLGQSGVAVTLKDTWERFVVTYENLPANTSYVRVFPYVSNIDNGDSFSIWAREAQCEKLDTATTWISGSLGDGYYWATAPHASISYRQEAYMDLGDYVSDITDLDVQSHRVVVQAPYDATGTWAQGQYNMVWDYRGSSDNNRVFLMYDSVDNRFEVFINGNYRLFSSVQSFEAGDWLDIIVNLNFGLYDSYELWINGELEDSDSTSLSTPTGITDWTLGDDIALSQLQGGWVYAEYTVYTIFLDQDDHIKALYLTGPTIDPGSSLQALTAPGPSAGFLGIIMSTVSGSPAVYAEPGPNTHRFQLDALWWPGADFQLEATTDISGADTGRMKLQYYDTFLAGWYDVEGSEVTFTNPLDRRIGDVCTMPRGPREYRPMWDTGTGAWVLTVYKLRLIISPGADRSL